MPCIGHDGITKKATIARSTSPDFHDQLLIRSVGSPAEIEKFVIALTLDRRNARPGSLERCVCWTLGQLSNTPYASC